MQYGGRAEAQAARVQARVKLCGIYRGLRGTGEGFLGVFQFPSTIIPIIVPHSSSSIIIRGWYNWPQNAKEIIWA
jgi:hypothetical protein